MANGFSRTPFIHLNIECHINKTSVNKGDTLEIKFIAFDRRPISDTSTVIGFIQLPLGVELITITSQTPYRGLGNSQFSWNVTRNKPNNIADEIVFTCKVTESQNFRDYVSSLGYFYRIEFLRVKSDNYYQPYGYNLNDSTNCSFFIPPPPPPPCDTCMYEFSPKVGKYFISGWCTSSNLSNLNQQSSAPKIVVSFSGTSFLNIFYPTGSIIDNWKKIEGEFTIPNGAGVMHIELLCDTGTCYFDDIRFHPLDGSMKSYTYDPITFRLSAELDERNYATFYEYDEEGKLTRIKKETEKGIMTIQENREALGK